MTFRCMQIGLKVYGFNDFFDLSNINKCENNKNNKDPLIDKVSVDEVTNINSNTDKQLKNFTSDFSKGVD